MSQQVKSLTFGTAQHSIWLMAMSAFLFPEDLCACVCVCVFDCLDSGLCVCHVFACTVYMTCGHASVCLWRLTLIPEGKFSGVKGQGHITEQHLWSRFSLQDISAGQMFVVTQAKTWTFRYLDPHCAVAVMCVCVCVCYSIHACPLHPLPPSAAPSRDLPGSASTLTAALALWGSVTTGQLQAEIRTGFIFLPEHFSVKRTDRRTKAETGRAVRWSSLLPSWWTGLNAQLQMPEHCKQKPADSRSHCVASSFAASFEAPGV